MPLAAGDARAVSSAFISSAGAFTVPVSGDHQHGPVGVSQHLLGDAAKKGVLHPRLALGAQDDQKAQMLALRRRRLQKLSFGISMLNILISAAVMILATYVQAE